MRRIITIVWAYLGIGVLSGASQRFSLAQTSTLTSSFSKESSHALCGRAKDLLGVLARPVGSTVFE
ncbi:hypothetical protein B0H13DRAFT_2365419 [Mycena leptocephala]|nr:hypothetical protein B0H13DRAFT_2365419 [Mycena leptocephala]